MRSELVFGAIPGISNRYHLCQLLAKATRKLHKPNTRLQDTVNDALVRLGSIRADRSLGNNTDSLPELLESRAA
jgi:hypothetical protein